MVADDIDLYVMSKPDVSADGVSLTSTLSLLFRILYSIDKILTILWKRS